MHPVELVQQMPKHANGPLRGVEWTYLGFTRLPLCMAFQMHRFQVGYKCGRGIRLLKGISGLCLGLLGLALPCKWGKGRKKQRM